MEKVEVAFDVSIDMLICPGLQTVPVVDVIVSFSDVTSDRSTEERLLTAVFTANHQSVPTCDNVHRSSPPLLSSLSLRTIDMF